MGIFVYVVGADGCRGGWFAVKLDSDGGGEINVFTDIAGLWEFWGNAALILVDVPIGLPDVERQERQCDKDARMRIGPRRSSVFPPPCRGALNATSYEDACQINRETVGKGLSLQAYGIRSKIREVDHLLREDPAARSRIREVHPEVCFWAFNGRQPLTSSKKTAGGRQERLELLESIHNDTAGIVEMAVDQFPRSMLAWDDILDATAAALTAACTWNGSIPLNSIPEKPCRDALGLPMEMVFAVLGEY